MGLWALNAASPVPPLPSGVVQLYFSTMNTSKAPFYPYRRWLPLALFAGFALLYVAFRSISLDDFDSYSFALALSDFDLELQQPQPPGFPVYVFLGRMLYRITGNARAALTWVSALSGAGVVVLVYALGVRWAAPARSRRCGSR